MIKILSDDGFEKIVMSNDFIEMIFLPKLGGKMISLKDKVTDTEFLLPNQHLSGKYILPKYGDDFSLFDCSGFDECFPNISQEKINIDGKDILLPDHGEIWNRESDYFFDDDELYFKIKGIVFNYQFEKTIKLVDREIIISYKLQNLSDNKFHYIWSAHPLLNVEQGDKIILPVGMQEATIYWSSDDKEKKGDKLSLPISNSVDFSIVQSRGFRKAVKLFSDRITDGSIGLFKNNNKTGIIFEFDTEKIPYIGLWLCYSGWPVDRKEKHFTVALEPTTSNTDLLTDAIKNNTVKNICPNEIIDWDLKIYLNK